MLFSLKNGFTPSLIALGIFVTAAVTAQYTVGPAWRLEPYPLLPLHLLLGLGGIVAGDALLHAMLRRVFGERYLGRYRRFVEYFRPQGPSEIAGGGALAAGEELLFRGALLEGLMSRGGISPPLAVTMTAILFGACHLLRDRQLAPFALWAMWQGVLLGTLYVTTGSLLVCLLVHAAHDLGGFTLFAIQRRKGRMLK